MSEYLDLNAVAIVYDGDFLASVPNTYKAFLECLRDKVGLSNAEFAKRTIWRGDFPILNRNDYINLLKKKGMEGIFQIDLVENDGEDEMRALSEWVSRLKNPDGDDVPLHISRFFPRFHMRDREATDVRLVYRLASIARENLKYVYTGNC